MDLGLDKVINNDKEILFRLLQYSLYEESLYDGNEMNDKGLFDYKTFDSFFDNNDKCAYFIKEKNSNKLLGFVMIITNNKGYRIEDFMVIPKYRNKKIGKQIAFMCFDKYKGYWEISPSLGSESAYIFWKKTIDEYTNNRNQYIDGKFIFNNNW